MKKLPVAYFNLGLLFLLLLNLVQIVRYFVDEYLVMPVLNRVNSSALYQLYWVTEKLVIILVPTIAAGLIAHRLFPKSQNVLWVLFVVLVILAYMLHGSFSIHYEFGPW